MATEAKIIFTGENRGLLELYEQERRKVQQKDEALRRASRVAKQAYDEERQLARDAAKAIERSLTPLERLTAEREKLRKQLALGIITEKEFQRLQGRLNQEFKEGKQNTAAYKDEQRKLNAEKQKARDITRSVETAEQRYARQLRELRAQLKAGRIDQQTFNRAVARARTELSATTSKMTAAEASLLRFAKGFAAFVGVHQLLRGIGTEMEHLRKLADDARIANLDFAGVMKGTRNAFAADATISDEQLEPRLLQAAKESRTSPKIVAAVMQAVFSAKGDATNEEAVQAATAALRLNPGDLEAGRTTAARALDLRQATGSTDFMANIGFIENVQRNARVEDIAQVGENLVPAIASMMSRGDTAEQAAEIVATLNQMMQDREGRRTRTAAISLSTQAREFVPEDSRMAAAYAKAGSTTERLQILQNNPRLAQEFLGKSSFEQSATAFVELLVTGDEKALALLADKRKKIKPLDASQAAELEADIQRKEAPESAQLLKSKEESEVSAEVADIADKERARKANARDILLKTVGKVNLPGPDFLTTGEIYVVGDSVLGLGFEQGAAATGQPERVAAGQLETIARRNLSDSDRAKIIEQIAILNRMADSMERTEANTRRQVNGAPTRPPAAALSVR